MQEDFKKARLDPAAFQLLFESAPGLYLVLTPDFRIAAVSEAYLRATMTEREDILGRGIFEVFPDNPEDPGATGVCNLRESLETTLRTLQPDTMAVQKYDIRRPEAEGGGFEERYWSPLNSPVIGPDGRLAYIIHRVADVTEFVRLKQAGNEQERLTEALRVRAGRMEAEIFLRAQEVADANRKLRAANEELARLYERIEQLMNQADTELQLKTAAAKGRSNREKGTPEDMLGRIGRLIADHQRLEEQMRQSQKMEAVGRLAGGVAHDFNNLLTVIGGYADLLLLSNLDGETAYRVQEINRAASRAATLTNQLLAFSRKQVLQPRVLDVNDVVSGTEDLIRRLIGENISLVIVLGSGLRKVKADRSQIEQVIMNLALNARDAMPNGGRLVIETRNVQTDAMDPTSATRSCPAVMLSVSDTGHGMDGETVARIFEPFFTTKEPGKGTGLGLATVYGIVEQSGGRLTVNSAPGKGSDFRVFLPMAESQTEDQDVFEQPAGSPGFSAGTVMIVEDEAPLRTLVATVLGSAGYRVLEAANGQEALSQAAQSPRRIDVLITDVVMPGLSGLDLVDQLQRSYTDLKVLFMSGYDRELIKRKSLQRAAAFLPKPFSPQTLLAKVAELLDSGGGIRAAAWAGR